MKKITIVSDFYPPHWTGIAKSIFYLADSIKEEFFTTVLTVQFKQQLPVSEKKEGIIIKRFPVSFTLSRAKFSGALIFHFLRNIKHSDVILINSPSIHILPISVIAKIFQKKLLIFHQGDLILPKGMINYFIQQIFDLASLISFALADQLATYTQDYAHNSRLLKKFLQKTQAFIPPLPYFAPTQLAGQVDQQLKRKLSTLKKKKTFLIGCAGRFVEEKGFDVLLAAIIKLKEQRDDFFLVFAGETNISYEKTFFKNQGLVNQLKDNLIFLGLLNDIQLNSFYQAIDLFILPSRSECFGLVQAEAMAKKTPVIVSDIPGARDPVVATGYGLLFEKNNPTALMLAIKEMLNHLKSFDKNYKKVVQYFDQNKAQRALLNFLKN
ncbi:MAG TPA: glycosyltransferase family 4 protein [Candidatus Woesebacteria bacterium]|nr:glycosyltransferase family 4 protein [Candidatus Woesebacteria bacterium]